MREHAEPIIEKRDVQVGWRHPSCDECGKPFTSQRIDAEVCGKTCRSKRWRARRAAKANQITSRSFAE